MIGNRQQQQLIASEALDRILADGDSYEKTKIMNLDSQSQSDPMITPFLTHGIQLSCYLSDVGITN